MSHGRQDELRVFAHVGAVDLVVALGATAIWLGFGLVDPRLFAALVVVHVPVWLALLWWLLGPVRAWSRAPARDAELIASADEAQGRLAARFSAGYAAVWALIDLGALAVAEPSPAEIVAGLAFVAAVLVPIPTVFSVVIPNALVSTRRALSAEVVDAGLVDRRPPVSLSARLGQFCMALTASLFALLLGSWTAWMAAHAGPGGVDLRVIAALFVLGCVSVPVSWLVARMLTQAVTGPLDELSAAVKDFLERGQLAEIERLVPLQNDEVGRAAIQFNAMLELLDGLTRAAEAVAKGELELEIDHQGELPAAFRAMVQRLAQTVLELRETAVELASVASELYGLTLSQREAAEEQSEVVSRVGASVSSLSDAAENIAARSKSVMEDAERAVEVTGDTSHKIAALRAQTANIVELVELIDSIADRSDILALNGSLEAVRAGEVGQGFALVAAEMRRLAERVAGALDDVRAQIETIDEAGATTVEAIHGSRRIAERTALAAAAISEVTLLQSEETRQAWGSMEQVMAMVERSSAAIGEVQQTAESLRGEAERLEALLAGFRIGPAVEGQAKAPPQA